jgi:signal transduction histidine kinase
MVLETGRRLRQARIRGLSKDGYEVSRTADMAQALSAAREDAFDLLIMNVDRPELLNMRLARFPPETGILIVADNDAMGRVAESAGTGVHSFLAEPCEAGRFRAAVAEAIDRSRLVRESILGEVVASLDGRDLRLAPEEPEDDLLRRIVETAAAAVSADYVVLIAGDAGTGRQATRAQAGESREAWERLCRMTAGVTEVVLVDEAMRDHPYHGAMMEADATAFLSVPLILHDGDTGALCCVRSGTGAGFSPADRALVSVLAWWSGMALDNSQLRQLLHEQTIQTDKLLNEVAFAQENERHRVAMEIHDGVAQWMVGASYSIKACSSLVAESRLGDLERELAITRETIQRSIRELRRAIADLRPLPLEEMGLAAAIRQASEALRQDGIHCSTLVEGTLPPLTPAEENTVYWIAQEMLTNVRKHSGATRVDIRLQFRDRTFAMEVRDDGKGFSPEEVMQSRSVLGRIGLMGMNERAKLLGGRLTIDSNHGKGTRVEFTFPVSAREPAGAV